MKKRQLKPLTFEVRKRLESIAKELPQMPMVKNGKVIIHKTARKVTGQELIDKKVFKAQDGTAIDANESYIERGSKVQWTNHKLQLFKNYQENGEDGVQMYLRMVEHFKKLVNEKKQQ